MSWTAKRGKYIHQDGCGAGPDEICTCEPPYPLPKGQHAVMDIDGVPHRVTCLRNGDACTGCDDCDWRPVELPEKGWTCGETGSSNSSDKFEDLVEVESADEIEEAIELAADAIKILFRHGGGGGATGISYGWNAEKQGYGIWNHETESWFGDQEYVKDIRDIDGPRYFARRVLMAAGAIPAPTNSNKGN